ncbi:hypothetical protein HHI36_005342, partial [Cryptolaemus montrouzieri]
MRGSSMRKVKRFSSLALTSELPHTEWCELASQATTNCRFVLLQRPIRKIFSRIPRTEKLKTEGNGTDLGNDETLRCKQHSCITSLMSNESCIHDLLLCNEKSYNPRIPLSIPIPTTTKLIPLSDNIYLLISGLLQKIDDELITYMYQFKLTSQNAFGMKCMPPKYSVK